MKKGSTSDSRSSAFITLIATGFLDEISTAYLFIYLLFLFPDKRKKRKRWGRKRKILNGSYSKHSCKSTLTNWH